MLNYEDYMKIFHEIKNSVTLINSYLQLVPKKHPEVTEFTYWSDITGEVSRLRAIVTELSHVKLGGHLNKEHIDLRDFITDICDHSLYADSTAGISFQINHSSDSLLAFIDPVLLRHAITNLLKNSYEAMGNTGALSIETSLQDNHAVVRIIDTGNGIPAEIADHIFDPFITTKSDGSGLGLVITRQIIEAHDGSLQFESRPDDGCTFTINLPAM